MKTLTVSGSRAIPGAFPTLSEAIAQIPRNNASPVTILIEPGIYHEKVTLSAPHVTLLGRNAADTILTWDDCATQQMPDGSRRGTFRSYTLLVEAPDVTLQGLTIRNSSAPRSRAGQAIALYADGDRLQVRDCRLISFQDTLFTGPLPPAPLTPGGFTGPRESAPRINTRQYYENCYICGDIDFIFGSATAWFEKCEIASVFSEELPPDSAGHPPVYGYVSAASTPEGQAFGYVFHGCDFTGTCPEGSVYLGRPWRSFARTVLLNCRLGPHIRQEGFHDWNKKDDWNTLFYAEYNSQGEGADPAGTRRAPFVSRLTADEAALYQISNVLSGTDGWHPGQPSGQPCPNNAQAFSQSF